MVGLRGGCGRLGLALGLGTILAAGGAWMSALADGPGPGGQVVRVAQKAAKKKAMKARKGMAGKVDADAAPKDAPEVASAADDGKLKFSRDVAPVLVGNCIGCHDPKSNNVKAHVLDLTTYKGLMAGTAKRRVIVAEKPDESPLLMRIAGDETPKMPPGNNQNIAEVTADKISAWIKDGAKLDAGKDPGAPIKSYARTPEAARAAELGKLTPEQRDQRVVDAGLALWKKFSPATPPESATGTRVILFSNLPKERAVALLKDMDKQLAAVRKFFGKAAPAALDGPLKLSLHVFTDAKNFVEFYRTIENREPEAEATAAGNFAYDYPFLAAVDPLAGREDSASAEPTPKKGKAAGMRAFGGPERSLAGLLTEQLAAEATTRAKGGKAPRWLALGVGALFGSRAEPRSPYYNHLRSFAFQQHALGWPEKAKEVLSDTTDAEKLRAGGFSMVEWIAKSQPEQLPALVFVLLDGSEKLDSLLTESWGVKRDEFISGWGAWILNNYSRAR